MQFTITDDNKNKRLDIFLVDNTEYTRSYIKKLIDEEKILVNGKSVKSGYSLKKDDVVDIKEIEKKEINILPKKIDMDILYEDSDIIIINKEKGVVVHPRKWKLYRYIGKWFVIFTQR